MNSLTQAAKFIAVGLSNTFIDLGVLNILVFMSGATSGLLFVIWKTISFAVASLNSFYWNKRWTFDDNQGIFAKHLATFYGVIGVGGLINISVTTFIVHYVPIIEQLHPSIGINLAAITGSCVAFIWNFLGCKYLVFRRS